MRKEGDGEVLTGEFILARISNTRRRPKQLKIIVGESNFNNLIFFSFVSRLIVL